MSTNTNDNTATVIKPEVFKDKTEKVRKYEEAAAKLREQEAAADEAVQLLSDLNEEYSVVKDGGKVWVMTFEDDPALKRRVPTFMTFEDFKKWHLNHKVLAGETKDGKPIYKDVGTWWLTHHDRKEYQGIVFQPGKDKVVNGRLNLWQGWGIEPKEGDWSLMKRHIHEVMADGDKASATYIYRWLAWMFQHPDQRAEVALVFKGCRGSGKGTLGNALCEIFGQHHVHISSAIHLTGRFNDHLRDACLLFADEAYWPGDKSAEGSLKRLITEPSLFLDGKNKPCVTVPNMLHVIMASNEDWVIPSGEGERRFAVFEVNEERRQDREWFGPLYEEMKNGGLAAMLHDMLKDDLGDWHPRYDIPRNAALLDQQARSLSADDAWYVSLLDDGMLPESCRDPSDPRRAVSRDWTEDKVTRRGLYTHARTARGLAFYSEHRLGSYLHKHAKCEPIRNVKPSNNRGWEFPPLAEARARWEARFPGWQWHQDVDEWGQQ